MKMCRVSAYVRVARHTFDLNSRIGSMKINILRDGIEAHPQEVKRDKKIISHTHTEVDNEKLFG